MSARDGGQAFPRPASETAVGVHDAHRGMTLRDYFAAAALQGGLVARAMADTERREGQTVGQQVAEIAYTIAERMIAEREKKAAP